MAFQQPPYQQMPLHQPTTPSSEAQGSQSFNQPPHNFNQTNQLPNAAMQNLGISQPPLRSENNSMGRSQHQRQSAVTSISASTQPPPLQPTMHFHPNTFFQQNVPPQPSFAPPSSHAPPPMSQPPPASHPPSMSQPPPSSHAPPPMSQPPPASHAPPPMSQPPSMSQPPPASHAPPPASHAPPPMSQPPSMSQPPPSSHAPPPMSQPPPGISTTQSGTVPPTSRHRRRYPSAATSYNASNSPSTGRTPSQSSVPPVQQPQVPVQGQPAPPQHQQHQQLQQPPPPHLQAQPVKQPNLMMQPSNYSSSGNIGSQTTSAIPSIPNGLTPPIGTDPSRQARRKGVDPEAVPSPVVVASEDQLRFQSTPFVASSRQNPPLANTDARIIDEGNASCRVVRPTLNAIPITKDLLNLSKIPLSLVVTPLAEPREGEPPVRLNGGRRWHCPFCECTNDTPDYYFCNLDHLGRRHDLMERPELMHGSVEFPAPRAYCARPPQVPGFLYLIDVSYNSVQTGVVATACEAIRKSIELQTTTFARQNQPFKMGIITYDSEIHFYNLSPGLAQPQMMTVSDVDDVFVPLQNGLLVNAVEAKNVILQLLDTLPNMFLSTRVVTAAYGAAMRAAMFALKDTGGRVLSLLTALPAVGPGTLKKRDGSGILGTDKEHKLFSPAVNFYQLAAKDCCKYGISFDLYMFPNSNMDVASMAPLAHRTGGSIFRYPYFRSSLHGKRLLSDMLSTCTTYRGCESMLRVRTSTGIRPTGFYGAFTMENTQDVELAGVDTEQTLVVQVQHDDKLTEGKDAHFQIALLYTNTLGERRIRVHTLSVKTASQLAEIFRSGDIDALVCTMAKMSTQDAYKSPLATLRTNMNNLTVGILASYRKHCASSKTASGELVLPESLKLLPVYANSMARSPAFRRGTDVSADERVENLHHVLTRPAWSLIPYFYPRLYPLHDITENTTKIPDVLRPSMRYIKDHGIYLVENGVTMMMLVGNNVPGTVIQQAFGADCVENINVQMTALPRLNNPLNQKLNQIVDTINNRNNKYLTIQIVRQKDPNVIYFSKMLVEDKFQDLSSYVDYLCAVHRQVLSTNT
eukprot:gene1940-5030_t